MFQKEYKQKDFYWGLKPNPILEEFINIIPKGRALDIGAGEGRNSIFLAQNGFLVEAIDKISEGLEKCKKLAKKHNLSINIIVQDVREFNFQEGKYSLILAIASLDFLKKIEVERILTKIKKSLVSSGFVLLVVFSTEDPLYQKIKVMGLKEIEENTFFLPKSNSYRHFFTKDEIRNAFNDFEIIRLKQKMIEDTSHGKPHFHNTIILLAKKIR